MPSSPKTKVFLLAILLAAVCLPDAIAAGQERFPGRRQKGSPSPRLGELGGSGQPGRSDFSPPLEGIVRYGCEAFLADEAWHLRVWAEHKDKGRDWAAIRSVHQGKNARAKCLKDCDAWMRQVDEKLKRAIAKSSR